MSEGRVKGWVVENVIAPTTLSVTPMGDVGSNNDLVRGIRKWAGFSLDERCAACGGEFYNADGSDTCYGCRKDYPFQRSLLRMKLVRVLEARCVDLIDVTWLDGFYSGATGDVR